MPGDRSRPSRAFEWSTFLVSVAVAGLSWALWEGLTEDAVTAWGFAATMVVLTVWASTRERYPLSMLLGTAAGLIVAFVALYIGEVLLWVVGLQMLLVAVLGPQVLLFLASRFFVERVGSQALTSGVDIR